jgi:hypothetical protein
MTVETRYYWVSTWTVNGLLTHKFLTTKDSVDSNTSAIATGNLTVYWGIRVFKRAADGSETEITSGVPVAEVSRSTTGAGMQSATWECPLVDDLVGTDAIVVRVYIKFGTGAYNVLYENITEQLGAQSLDSATWTVNYYNQWSYATIPNFTRGTLYIGGTTFLSGVKNFTWTPAAVAIVLRRMLVGVGL